MAFRCITRSTARPTGASPLVLLHGGGDTIGTSFGHVLPVLARDRQVIAFEQQGFGHTDDAAALLKHCIGQADLFGSARAGRLPCR